MVAEINICSHANCEQEATQSYKWPTSGQITYACDEHRTYSDELMQFIRETDDKQNQLEVLKNARPA